MNQKEWVEYFEAVNGRKPSMQEFQVAREKGEFVFNKLNTPAPATVAPQPQVQLTNPAGYSQTVPRQNGSKFSFNKKITIGLSIAGLVAVIGLVCFFFFSSGPSLDGVWYNNLTSYPYVYNLKEKQKKFNDNKPINEVIKGNEAKKEFNEKLLTLHSSNLKTLADVDKKFNLKTKEVVIVKLDNDVIYNLMQSNGSNIILANDLYDLERFKTNSQDFNYKLIYYKVEIPKAIVGKWKMVEGDNIDEDEFQVTDHGLIFDHDVICPFNEGLRVNEVKGISNYTKHDFKDDFKHVQNAIEEQGYEVDSSMQVFKEAQYDHYLVLVDGGKKIITLTNGYNYVSTAKKVK